MHTWKTGIFLLFLTVSCLAAVLILAGNDFGYAGVDYHLSFISYFKTAFYLYGKSGGVLLAVSGTIYLLWKKKINGKYWLYPSLLFMTVTIPQIVIYAKSNFIDRYLIPAMIGCAYFSIFTYYELKKNDKQIKESLWKNISLALGLVVTVLCCFALFDTTFQQGLIDFTVRRQGEVLQAMTSVASLHYLSSTISTVGIAGLLVGFILLVWGCLRNNHFISKLSQCYICGLFLIFLVNCGFAFASCQRYAMRGFATENFLNTIINHSATDNAILIVGDPLVEIEDVTAGISTYLHKYNRDNLFICPMSKTDKKKELSFSFSIFVLNFYQHKNTDAITDKNSIKVIAIFPGLESLFENANSWFDAESFNRYEFTGNYIVYAKK
ncbi:hypothetical protein Barb6XT_01076 [Bacteroidales bacterium Barb6XT]|nr:hypothetical protein Barb6XT_01076 [Bacteroidales bacterium Barb6XT]